MVAGMNRPTVAIVGLGLVGGSLARALTAAGYRVIGHDRPRVLRQAVAARAIAVAARSVPLAVADADLVVLAASPRTNRRLLGKVARAARTRRRIARREAGAVPASGVRIHRRP